VGIGLLTTYGVVGICRYAKCICAGGCCWVVFLRARLNIIIKINIYILKEKAFAPYPNNK
jgi:hypothetical protein